MSDQTDAIQNIAKIRKHLDCLGDLDALQLLQFGEAAIDLLKAIAELKPMNYRVQVFKESKDRCIGWNGSLRKVHALIATWRVPNE